MSLSLKKLVASAAILLAAIAVLHYVCLHFYPKRELDIYDLSDFYPLSVFKLRRPSLVQLGLACVFTSAFAWLWEILSRREPRLYQVFFAGLLLAVLSNLLHGWRFGIDYATASTGDSGFEYYHDASVIQGPLWFLQRFNAIQFELLEHARTHPPGPVLLYYGLHLLTRDPGLISIAVTALFLGLALPYLRRLCRLAFVDEPRGALLLFCILPAVLIYGLAVIDAPIAALFLATVVEFVDDRQPRARFLSAIFLALSLFFSFGALFLVPVLVGFELLRKRSVNRSLWVLGLAALLLLSLKPLFAFNWLQAFVRASLTENDKGFLLLADPRRYLWYRLGAVAEIACYFTPFLCSLAWRGRAALKQSSPDFHALAWLGPASLCLMLLSGAMKIGEAARICIFILPYLLLPALAVWRNLDERSRRITARAVFGWGLVMQLFGFYQW